MDVNNSSNKNDDIETRSLQDKISLSGSVENDTQTWDSEHLAPFSVTAVLSYCKTKILKPYLLFLSITGLRSLSSNQSDSVTCTDVCSYLYIFILLLLMVMGYVLQYMACFRRDRGFGYIMLGTENSYRAERYHSIYESICNDSIVFSYAIPHILHFIGYIYAFFVFRSSDDDLLPRLIESVFLSLSNLSNGFQSQKKLVRMLWICVSISLIWMILSLIAVILMMGEGIIEFKWFSTASPGVVTAMKMLLVLSTLWHDVIQATVISNYCLQAQLLTSYIHFVKEKLIQNLIQLTEWVKDVEDFRKLLSFLNNGLAPSVCLFTLVNISRAITGILWFLNLDRIDRDNACAVGINSLNITLWILLSSIPFVQAARLTTSCEMIRSVGHETRVRPFTHQDTPSTKLDSILLYSANLRLKAKLFGIPIKMHYLYLFLIVCIIVVIVLGQLHYLFRKT